MITHDKDWTEYTQLRHDYIANVDLLRKTIYTPQSDFLDKWKSLCVKDNKFFWYPEMEYDYDDSYVEPVSIDELERLVKKIKSLSVDEYLADETNYKKKVKNMLKILHRLEKLEIPTIQDWRLLSTPRKNKLKEMIRGN